MVELLCYAAVLLAAGAFMALAPRSVLDESKPKELSAAEPKNDAPMIVGRADHVTYLPQGNGGTNTERSRVKVDGAKTYTVNGVFAGVEGTELTVEHRNGKRVLCGGIPRTCLDLAG